MAFTQAPDAELLGLLRQCGDVHLRVQVVPRLFDLLGPQTEGLGNLGLVDVTRRRPAGVELAAKRIVDIIISAFAVTLLLPVILAIAVWIKVDDRGPVLFRQHRIGRRGQPFRICKFRTMSMVSERDELATVGGLESGDVHIEDAVRRMKSAGEQRVTRVGRFLRRTSLDESPALECSARRDESRRPASLAGLRILAALEPWQARRQDVLPGVTGLWQVLGRSDVDWHERQQLDFSYAPLVVSRHRPPDPRRRRSRPSCGGAVPSNSMGLAPRAATTVNLENQQLSALNPTAPISRPLSVVAVMNVAQIELLRDRLASTDDERPRAFIRSIAVGVSSRELRQLLRDADPDVVVVARNGKRGRAENPSPATALMRRARPRDPCGQERFAAAHHARRRGGAPRSRKNNGSCSISRDHGAQRARHDRCRRRDHPSATRGSRRAAPRRWRDRPTGREIAPPAGPWMTGCAS